MIVPTIDANLIEGFRIGFAAGFVSAMVLYVCVKAVLWLATRRAHNGMHCI